MRRYARAVVVALLTFLGAVAIGVMAVLTSAVTLAAFALIVPGTGTHNIDTVKGYKENALNRYIAPADPSCTTTSNCNLVGINYPASFWPIPLPGWCPNLSCDTWNVSVGTGIQNLDATLQPLLTNPNNKIVLFGYSQGGAVVSQEMYNLANLPQSEKNQIQVVTIGNIDNPQGLWARLSFLPTIPILNVTFGPLLPTGIGIKSTNYAFQYDPVGDAPLYLLDPFSLLNALAAFYYVHGNYLVPNSNDPMGTLPYGYTPTTLAQAITNPANISTYQDATFVLIPDPGTLPLLQPLLDLGNATGTTAIVKPFVDLLNPIVKVLVDLGYDRNANPGIPQTFQLFPPINPITLGINLVVAVVQGIQAALKDIIGDPPGASTVAPPAPAGPSTSSTFAPAINQTSTPNTTTQTLKPRVVVSTSDTVPTPTITTQPPKPQVVVSTSNTVPTPTITTQPPKPQEVVGASTQVPKPTTTTQNGSSASPFNLVQLPKSAGSNATPATGQKTKPDEVVQSVTAPPPDPINDVKKPNTAGTSTSGSKAAA